MALARSQREWSILIGEYNICKKKLESKREALKIMKKEWLSVQRERDIYKNKINQLQQDLDKYALKEKQKPIQKEQPRPEPKRCVQSPDLLTSQSSRDSLAQLVIKYKEINKALRKDFFELKKLYVESQEDVQILRDRMRKTSSSSSIGEESSTTLVSEGKEELIVQLEEYKGQVASLEQELKSVKDENSDVTMERNHYKDKCQRLNNELNYILGADDRRLVDIDALVLDNKYLKEKLAQLEEERSIEKESIQKYEAAFDRKKSKLLYRGYIEDRLSSYHSKGSNERSSKTIADLRNVANILSETITEKNLALTHQRNANKILGKRVNELENKLKTLEVAGLWSLPGHRGYGSSNLKTNQSGLNGEELEKNAPGSGTNAEKLEWDDSLGLVELTDLEKAKFLERAVLENIDISRKTRKTLDSVTPDFVSRLATGSGSDHDDVTHNGYSGDSLKAQYNTEKMGKEMVANSVFQEDFTTFDQLNGSFQDVLSPRETSGSRRLSRALSAPTLFCESFDENANLNGGNSPDLDK